MILGFSVINSLSRIPSIRSKPSSLSLVTVAASSFLVSWIKIDQLCVTCFIISLFTARHVTNVSTSIFRSLRLIVDLFHALYWSGSMCVGVTVWFGWGDVVSLCRLKQCFSLLAQICVWYIEKLMTLVKYTAPCNSLETHKIDCYKINSVFNYIPTSTTFLWHLKETYWFHQHCTWNVYQTTWRHIPEN